MALPIKTIFETPYLVGLQGSYAAMAYCADFRLWVDDPTVSHSTCAAWQRGCGRVVSAWEEGEGEEKGGFSFIFVSHCKGNRWNKYSLNWYPLAHGGSWCVLSLFLRQCMNFSPTCPVEEGDWESSWVGCLAAS